MAATDQFNKGLEAARRGRDHLAEAKKADQTAKDLQAKKSAEKTPGESGVEQAEIDYHNKKKKEEEEKAKAEFKKELEHGKQGSEYKQKAQDALKAANQRADSTPTNESKPPSNSGTADAKNPNGFNADKTYAEKYAKAYKEQYGKDYKPGATEPVKLTEADLKGTTIETSGPATVPETLKYEGIVDGKHTWSNPSGSSEARYSPETNNANPHWEVNSNSTHANKNGIGTEAGKSPWAPVSEDSKWYAPTDIAKPSSVESPPPGNGSSNPSGGDSSGSSPSNNSNPSNYNQVLTENQMALQMQNSVSTMPSEQLKMEYSNLKPGAYNYTPYEKAIVSEYLKRYPTTSNSPGIL